MSVLERFRNTGRTDRMLKAVLETALSVEDTTSILAVFKNPTETLKYMDQFLDQYSEFVTGHNRLICVCEVNYNRAIIWTYVESDQFNWLDFLAPAFGQQIFVDPDALEFAFTRIIEAYHKWDLNPEDLGRKEGSTPVFVTKDQFMKYLRVQRSGQFNMLSSEALEATELSAEIFAEINLRYSDFYRMYLMGSNDG